MLKPWEHFVPVPPERLEQLEQTIEYFKKHQNVSLSMAARGFDAVRNHLRMKDIICYWKKLLKSYAKLIKFDVQRDPMLLEIKKISGTRDYGEL